MKRKKRLRRTVQVTFTEKSDEWVRAAALSELVRRTAAEGQEAILLPVKMKRKVLLETYVEPIVIAEAHEALDHEDRQAIERIQIFEEVEEVEEAVA